MRTATGSRSLVNGICRRANKTYIYIYDITSGCGRVRDFSLFARSHLVGGWGRGEGKKTTTRYVVPERRNARGSRTARRRTEVVYRIIIMRVIIPQVRCTVVTAVTFLSQINTFTARHVPGCSRVDRTRRRRGRSVGIVIVITYRSISRVSRRTCDYCTHSATRPICVVVHVI